MQSLLINTPYDFDGHPIFKLGSMLVTRILNQTTRGKTLWRTVHLETDITTCSHIAKIHTQAFLLSVTHVNHTYLSAMQADTSEKVTVTWLLRCKHYIVIASSQV